MKADRIKMYLDMYYNAEIPDILERETETEKSKMKEKFKSLVDECNNENGSSVFLLDRDKLFRKIDNL